MKDEIKEINIKIPGQILDYVDTKEHLLDLFNYITNLQEENERLKTQLNCKEYFSATMPENTEFVILTKNNYDRQQKDIQLDLIDYKSRCEKALSIIEKQKAKMYKSRNKIAMFILMKLEKVLQGVGKDEN